MSTLFNIQDIMDEIPHRYPFLFVDKVVEFDEGKRLVAYKNLTMNEPFFQGHFPGRPVMPGVIMIEALAQAAGVLAFKSPSLTDNRKGLFLLTGVDNARFKRVVVPGDQLKLDVEIIKVRRDICVTHGIATVDGELACKADIMSYFQQDGVGT